MRSLGNRKIKSEDIEKGCEGKKHAFCSLLSFSKLQIHLGLAAFLMARRTFTLSHPRNIQQPLQSAGNVEFAVQQTPTLNA